MCVEYAVSKGSSSNPEFFLVEWKNINVCIDQEKTVESAEELFKAIYEINKTLDFV